MGIGGIFLNRTPMACAVRSRIGKWNLTKLQSFFKAKDTVKKAKWHPTDWEKIVTYPTSHQIEG
jgi:phage-related protein